MSELFTNDEINSLTKEINQQLQSVQHTSAGITQFKGALDKKAELTEQRKIISEQSGEAADSFLKRFANNARKDLCESGGMLHDQWKEVKDLSSKKMIKTFGSVLAGMGLAGLPLQAALVAICVYILHIGVETFCEENG